MRIDPSAVRGELNQTYIQSHSGDVRDPAHHCRPDAGGAKIATNPDGFDEQTCATAARHPRYISKLHSSNNLLLPVNDEEQFVGRVVDYLLQCGSVHRTIGFRGYIASRGTDGVIGQKVHE